MPCGASMSLMPRFMPCSASYSGGPTTGRACQRALDLAEHALVAGPQPQPVQVDRQPAGRRRVGAAVVVDHHDHRTVGGGDVVQRLPAHAAGQRAVADDGDDGAPLVAHRECLRQPVGVGQRRRRVRVLDPVVLALGAAGVAGQPAGLAQRRHRVGAAGEDLVHVGLVADVEQDRLARRVEDPVQGDGELDRAQVRARGARRSARPSGPAGRGSRRPAPPARPRVRPRRSAGPVSWLRTRVTPQIVPIRAPEPRVIRRRAAGLIGGPASATHLHVVGHREGVEGSQARQPPAGPHGDRARRAPATPGRTRRSRSPAPRWPSSAGITSCARAGARRVEHDDVRRRRPSSATASGVTRAGCRTSAQGRSARFAAASAAAVGATTRRRPPGHRRPTASASTAVSAPAPAYRSTTRLAGAAGGVASQHRVGEGLRPPRGCTCQNPPARHGERPPGQLVGQLRRSLASRDHDPADAARGRAGPRPRRGASSTGHTPSSPPRLTSTPVQPGHAARSAAASPTPGHAERAGSSSSTSLERCRCRPEPAGRRRRRR